MEKTKSLLGDKSQFYLQKSTKRGSIQDHPGEGYLEFYPSGYSHVSRRDKVSRQLVQQAIYEAAVEFKREEEDFPFRTNHTIRLQQDINNPVDPNAMWVILDAPQGLLHQYHDRDIGFVPAEIAGVLKASINRITDGRIYKVKANWYKKYYSCKVVLYYGRIPVTDDPSLGRFADIIMEA